MYIDIFLINAYYGIFPLFKWNILQEFPNSILFFILKLIFNI